MKEPVTVTWLGHACFKMEYKKWSLVIDPYADGSVPGLSPIREQAHAVYCTHTHGDHNAKGNVKIKIGRPRLEIAHRDHAHAAEDVIDEIAAVPVEHQPLAVPMAVFIEFMAHGR